MNNIERLREHNQPGGCYLQLVPVTGVASVPYERFGVVEDPIVLANGGAWVRVDPTRFTQDFGEKWELKNGARMATATLECDVPKDRVALLYDLYQLGIGRYLVLHHDLNGTTKLLGTKDEPATVRVYQLDHGRGGRANEGNTYRMRIELARSTMCPFYGEAPPPSQVPGECLPVTVLINGYEVAIVASGGFVNLSVANSNLVPSGGWNVDTSQWVVNTTCAPAMVQLVNSAGWAIGPPVLVPSGSTPNLMAPDGTAMTTDMSTPVITVKSGGVDNLPQSVVKYKDETDADQVTAPSFTQFADARLRPADQVPRRPFTVNTTPVPLYATLGRLLDDSLPDLPVVDEDDNPTGAWEDGKWRVSGASGCDPYYAIAIGHP